MIDADTLGPHSNSANTHPTGGPRDRDLSAATNRLAVVVEKWRDPAEALAAYERWLVGLPPSKRARREYTRWVRLYCGWLRDGIDERAVGADPLGDPRARDYATRDFKRFLKSERMLGARVGEPGVGVGRSSLPAHGVSPGALRARPEKGYGLDPVTRGSLWVEGVECDLGGLRSGADLDAARRRGGAGRAGRPGVERALGEAVDDERVVGWVDDRLLGVCEAV